MGLKWLGFVSAVALTSSVVACSSQSPHGGEAPPCTSALVSDIGRYAACVHTSVRMEAQPVAFWLEVQEASAQDWTGAMRSPRLEVAAGAPAQDAEDSGEERLPYTEWFYGLKPGTRYQSRICREESGGAPLCDDLRAFATMPPTSMKWIGIDPENPKRLADEDGNPFQPWGNNLVTIADAAPFALIEDVMYDEVGLALLAEDLDEHKVSYAPEGVNNAARIHLQLHTFLRDAATPNREAFARFTKVVEMAEDRDLYLMVTGLNYFYPADNPIWIAHQDEAHHWASQAIWWNEMASALRHSPAPFLYDLMNEPAVPGNWVRDGEYWYVNVGPRAYCSYGADPDLGFHGTCFVQFITADPGTRPRSEIAATWVEKMVQAIRFTGSAPNDSRHLITVGAAGLAMTDAFQAPGVHALLDVISPHLYPEDGDAEQVTIDFAAALSAQSGKPLVVGETFSLPSDPTRMITETCAAGAAIGWIGQQDGRAYGDYCSKPPPWGCAFFDLWYIQQKDLSATIRAGQCPSSP